MYVWTVTFRHGHLDAGRLFAADWSRGLLGARDKKIEKNFFPKFFFKKIVFQKKIFFNRFSGFLPKSYQRRSLGRPPESQIL